MRCAHPTTFWLTVEDCVSFDRATDHVRWCTRCCAVMPIGPASPTTDVEMSLAEALADHVALFEPGAARDAADELAIAAALAHWEARAVRCKHLIGTLHRKQVGVYSMWTCRCDQCGEWVPFEEPARDTAAVLVEIRAAEIAVTGCTAQQRCNGAEIAGWVGSQFDSAKVPEQDGEWSGWLAHVIATHGEGNNG